MRMEDEMVCRKVEGVKRKRRLPGDQMHGKWFNLEAEGADVIEWWR
jgi:hypothetical protein